MIKPTSAAPRDFKAAAVKPPPPAGLASMDFDLRGERRPPRRVLFFCIEARDGRDWWTCDF